jgi:hypothetical protein
MTRRPKKLAADDPVAKVDLKKLPDACAAQDDDVQATMCFGWRAQAPVVVRDCSGMARLRAARSRAYSLVAGQALSGGEVQRGQRKDGRRRRTCQGVGERDQDLGKGTHMRTLTQRTRPPRNATRCGLRGG